MEESAVETDPNITTGNNQPVPGVDYPRPERPANTGALPRTSREAVLRMPAAFNPAAAGNLKAILQISLRGEGGGDYYLIIANGRCTAVEGRAAEATTTINAPADVWLRIARGSWTGPRP